MKQAGTRNIFFFFTWPKLKGFVSKETVYCCARSVEKRNIKINFGNKQVDKNQITIAKRL